VRIDSTTGNEEKMSEVVLEHLLSMGLSAKKDKHGNVIATREGEGKPILFTAHLDTVSPGTNIEPVMDGDFIKSKGDTILGADNKAAVAAILEVLRSTNTKRKLEIVFTVSEERKNTGALNLDYSKLEAKKGFCFDCGEKIGTIITKSPFYDNFKITVKGKASHAAFPEKGINALSWTAHSITKIKTGKVDKESVINIGKIYGGSTINTVPGEVILEGEIRSFDRKKIESHEKRIKKTFLNQAKPKSSVEIEIENSGYVFTKKDKDLNEVSKILSGLGVHPRRKASWGCSDANIFNEKGIKIVNLGEGAENIHTTNERIKKESLVSLALLISQLASEKVDI